MGIWRVGTHYLIHVYEGDVPVATFFTSADAHIAVEAHNSYVEGREHEYDENPTDAQVAIYNVLKLHQYDSNDRDAEWCIHDRQDWPCATIRALRKPVKDE